MCGISGIWNFNGHPASQESVTAMTQALSHRGPDEEGSYINGPVGLGHCRLSIIDISTGQQPMCNENRKIWITYNGEVYNFEQLRGDLLAKGHSFRTRSDTEIIVHLYEEMGPRCVDLLRGMFAFAIWDDEKKTMLLARDRLGLKPLYYLLDENRLIFSSEIKGILAADTVRRDINYDALYAYFTRDYIPSPDSIYANIHKLPPAHILICSPRSSSLKQYWHLQNAGASPDSSKTEEDYLAQLEALLKESVSLRMVSDVPVGVLLSGGVDSSTVLAMMAQISDQPVKTFSIGSGAADYDELKYARMVAERFGTDHRELIVQPDALEIVPTLVEGYDEPFSDASSVPTYYVSKLAREEVKVCLAGDGGDEIFAGYDWYSHWASTEWSFSVPWWIRMAFFSVPQKIWPKRWRGNTRLELLTAKNRVEHYAVTKARFSQSERNRLLTPELREQISNTNYSDGLIKYGHQADSRDYVEAMQYVDLMTYLPEDLLVKVDRASMMHGLEVRLPLLDHKLVEFAANIPTKLKLANGESKYILKKFASKWVPPEAIYRKKMGFGIPIQHWFKDELFGFTREILLDDRTRHRRFFEVDQIDKALESYRSGEIHNSITYLQIWNLLVLELWCRTFLDSPKNS